MFWLEPRRARVEPDAIIVEKRRKGPMAVEPMRVVPTAGGSSWSQVASMSKSKPAEPEAKIEAPVEKSPVTKEAVAKVSTTLTKTMFKKVSIKPPPTEPNPTRTQPKSPAEKTHAPITLKKKTMSKTLGLPTATKTEVSSASGTAPKPSMPEQNNKTISIPQHGPEPAASKEGNPNPVQPKPATPSMAWSKVAAGNPVVTKPVVGEPAAPIKAPLTKKKKVTLVASKGLQRT